MNVTQEQKQVQVQINIVGVICELSLNHTAKPLMVDGKPIVKTVNTTKIMVGKIVTSQINSDFFVLLGNSLRFE